MAEGRKVVTVVFTDVSGSTELGERLDPEALRRVLELFFSEMRAVLEAHGGTVEKFIGDAVVAVFGIPTVHEDDALRAVRAAAEMRERLSTLNVRLQREQGTALAVRTGVNTGEVVAGSSEEGQFYATGDAVNVAARLEQAAPPGEILLGETTYRLVRDAVTTEPVEPLALKGKAGAVEAHRLLEIVARAPAFARRFDAPFVGREAELAQLLACFERSANERTPVLVTALGDAGVGKTRLAAELVACLGDRATVGRGHCLSYGEGITFWPLQEIVRGLPQLPAGVPDPERARTGEEVFWAYRKVFEALARERQLVLVLEDLHWAEPTLLDLIDHVVEWTHDAPMLILCIARPDLLDERPGWPGDRIAVEPLAEGDAQALLGALAGDLELETRSRIAQAAEGNPLFLEQLLALAEEDSRNVQVTPTIQALLAARLGRLETEERALIERAAIVGREFWLGALRALSPPDFEVSAILQRLVRKRFVRPESSSFSGEDAFRFEHILVRDAAYEGTAKQTRADLHERFAEWLVASASPYDEIVGHHLEQAYGYRAELGPADDRVRALGDRASGLLESSGRRALDHGDPAAAQNLFERARSLASDSARRLTLSSPLAESLERAGHLERAWALFAETVEEAEAQGDVRNEWLARVGYADIGFRLAPGEWSADRVRETAETALRVFEPLGDDLGLARAWTLASDASGTEGRYDDAASKLRQARTHARRLADEEEEIVVVEHLLVYMYLGTAHVGAVLEEAEAFVARTGGSPHEMSGVLILAGLRGMQGATDESRHLYLRAKTIGEEMGLKQKLATSTLCVEEVALLGGDPEFAEQELRIGYEELERMGERGLRSTVAVVLADALHELGRDEEGERFVDIALDLAAADDAASQVRGRAVKSKLLAARGEYGAAEQAARDAAAHSAATDDLFMHSQVLMSLVEVLRRAGRHEDAVPVLEAAAEVSERKGNVLTARAARAQLAELGAVAKS